MHKVGFKHFNHIVIGLVIGLIVPLIGMHLVLKYQLPNFTLKMLIESPIFSPIFDSLKGCLFFNLGVFFTFYWLKKDHSARGVIFATILYGIFYLYYMFFM